MVGSEVIPAARSGEETRRRSPQTRLMRPHGHGYGNDDDIKPDFLKTQQEDEESEAEKTHQQPNKGSVTQTNLCRCWTKK